MTAMQMQMLARGYLVYDLERSASLLGLVSAASAFPLLGLSLFGGALADRFDKKRIIQFGQFASGLISLFISVTIVTDTVTWYHLLGAATIHGAVMSFLMPARQAIIPQLVGHDRLSNALVLDAAGMSAMTVMAPSVAGILYALLGPGEVYYVITALNFSAILLVGLLPKLPKSIPSRKPAMLSDIWAGLAYVRRSNLVLILVIMGLFTTLLAMPFRFLLPVFVVDIYHRGPDDMGLLLTAMGVGTLLGSLFIASLGKWKRGLLLIAGSFLSGISLLTIAVLPYYYLAMGIMLFLGIGDTGRRALNQALVMEAAEDAYRGRVWSIFMLNFGLIPLGVLPAGIAVDYLGGQETIAIMAVLLLVTSAVVLVTQRQLRTLD